MTLSRRQFVTRLSAATAATTLHPYANSALGFSNGVTPRQIPGNQADATFADPERLRKLATSAIDTAKAAGALFADCRITRMMLQWGNEAFSIRPPIRPSAFPDTEHFTIGVRALVDGYWGFAASPYWEVDEAVQLAKDAVAQARYNAKGGGRHVDLGKVVPVTGSWVMPVEIDPFTIPLEEKIEWLTARVEEVNRYRERRKNVGIIWVKFQCARQERVVANTEGSYYTQIVYRTGGEMLISVGGRVEPFTAVQMIVPGFTPAGLGWEIFQRPVWDRFLETVAEGETLAIVPRKPLDVGRYDVVFDAETAASILDQTLGPATELDRMMGFEANASGTSFLGSNPMNLLGAFQCASKFVNVAANRTDAGGLATVQWDDEGIDAHHFPLVQNGILTDLQTTRESAAWIAPWYTQRGQAVRSHGCAAAEEADAITMQHRPNLVLEPAASNVSLDDLFSHVDKGLYFTRGTVRSDFQARTGLGTAIAREIVNGKLGALVEPAAFSFDTLELWKNVTAIGGPGTEACIAGQSKKGEPEQTTWHSVTAVPMAATGVAVVDPMRKA